MITAAELRNKYFEFFKEKGHTLIPSASLVPENDPTVLFTTAGMHPLVPYLLGEKHPAGKRVVNVQKCVRTGDIEEVGDAIHHTFFEMLGNWSLGDYFKDEAIKWSWEFLTDKKWLGIDKDRLAISIFAGDVNAPLDEESKKIWLGLGVSEERIAALPKKNNWWGPAGQTGPCGPDTEMFYWSGAEPAPAKFDPDDERWVEIWNNVFMQYNKKADRSFEPLAQKNVDTGMGLERTLAVLNGLDDNYLTELFLPIIQKIEELSGKKYDESSEIKRAMRIIADHIKAAVFMAADGVVPSNTERGYVLRRLIRRAVRYGLQLGLPAHFTALAARVVIDIFGSSYGELRNKKEFIEEELVKEEAKFARTLERGLKELHKLKNNIDAKRAFDIYQTFGFPLELIKEELVGLSKKDDFIKDDEEFQKEFNEYMKKHQELSRTAAEGRFKGGLADNSEMTTKYHTATHLLHAALRQILGSHVQQKGSNITAERLRFDFSHQDKMTDQQIVEVEKFVNDAIVADYPVSCEEMSVADAKARGALGLFESKYGDKVKLYSIGTVSKEICGGPHVERTGSMGHFRITKEQASSAGVRRIRAILE